MASSFFLCLPLSSFLTTPNLNSHMDGVSFFTAEMVHVHPCTKGSPRSLNLTLRFPFRHRYFCEYVFMCLGRYTCAWLSMCFWGMCVCASTCVYGCTCMCVHACVQARGNLGYCSYWKHPPWVLRRFSLAWNSPVSLGWSVSPWICLSLCPYIGVTRACHSV